MKLYDVIKLHDIERQGCGHVPVTRSYVTSLWDDKIPQFILHFLVDLVLLSTKQIGK